MTEVTVETVKPGAVKVVGIDIPFVDLMTLMLKLVFACIPAGIVILLMVAVLQAPIR